VIGIDPRYYWNEMSLDEVVAVLKANDEVIKRKYELTRLQCYYSATVMGNKTDDGKRIDRPDKLFKLPWDGEGKPEVKIRTREEAMAALEEMRKNKKQ
jgi:hypothetical protein